MVQLASPRTTDEMAPPGLSSGLRARYERFMSERPVRAFLHRGGEVFLATEGQSTANIRALVGLGHRHFAEKYVREAEQKWTGVRASIPGLRLSDFGRLQTNKVRAALSLFDAIESVDRHSLALALQRRLVGGEARPRLYIQVNTGREPQKGGVPPEQLELFCGCCRGDLGLPIAGLMAIPPRLEDPRPHFRLLRRLADDAGLAECCMGMSDDYEIAVDCGATSIRIGRAVFDTARDCRRS